MDESLQYANRSMADGPPVARLLLAAAIELDRTAAEYRQLLRRVAPVLQTAAEAGRPEATAALLALQDEDRLSQHQDQLATVLRLLAETLGADAAETDALAAALESRLTVEAIRAPLLAALGHAITPPADAAAAAGEPELF
ncbi:hypothetical protein [Caenispirillum bisanense]|uniref:Uncharacterized protein n=1 Tax=Caenispirillum bisanense TaxID=414052 RepID=A0A286G3Z5_9PROT|nr:hypothetical protein [Caenispirillum bisanense]SOD90235.1 hypothetical protein SAMN05421508_101484 [Caenispirillum bisanense]